MELPVHYSRLTRSQRRGVREEYMRRQEGKCHFCGSPLDGPASSTVTAKKVNWRRFPPNFCKYPVHLHHSHATDETIGAVHAYCNAVFWQYHGE